MLPVFGAASPTSLADSSSDFSTNPLTNPSSNVLSQGEIPGPGLGEDILPPEEAFPPPHLEIKGADTLIVRWRIAKGYYLYRDRFRFGIEGDPNMALGQPQIPRGVFKEEDDSGAVEVFVDAVTITLPLIRAPSGMTADKEVRLIVGYQGCAEAGLCYPPFTKTLPLDLPTANLSIPDRGISASNNPTTTRDVVSAKRADANTAAASIPSASISFAESDRLAYTILANNLWVVLPIFFGFGLLLGFTPCVFPMIPILAGIIAGQGKTITTRKAFGLSLVYVLAMASTYTVAGVIAGLSGHNLQAAFQDPWVIAVFSVIFVLLALSMFGLFRMQIPSGWQTKLAMLGNLQQGGTFIGVGVMGLLSALIVGPCVAPPLAGALIAIGTTGDPIRGGLALFSLSLGMGLPLMVMGASAGRWLPKAGPWMRVTNHIFGVLLLAVALYLLERILPGWIGLLLWGILSIMIGVYLGAGERSARGDDGWRRFRKGAGIVALVYGIMLMVGAGAGGEHLLRPLEGFTAGNGQENRAPVFERVKTVAALQAKLAAIRAQNSAQNGAGKLTLLDYYADWCIECKRMEARTFPDPGVRAVLADMVLLRADVTDNDQQDQAMLRAFGLYGPPAILFFGPDGKEYPAYRVQGFMDASAFREQVRRVRQGIP